MASRLLSGVLAIPQDVIRQKLEGGGTFVWIQRKLPPEKAEAVKSLNLKGIYFQEENQRYYRSETWPACLGFVDVDEKGLGESSMSTTTYSGQAKDCGDGRREATLV